MILAGRHERSGASFAPAGADGAGAASPAPVLSVDGLTVVVGGEHGPRPVVSDLSFTLSRGETLCIAGESGSGKSMTSLAIMGLLPKPGARIEAGTIRLGDTDLASLGENAMRRIRGDRIAMIFQEPMTSLNPVLTIGRQLTEAIEAHESVGRAEARRRAVEALKAVRIPDAESRLSQHPHELSGGMRQRVMIAMALALQPGRAHRRRADDGARRHGAGRGAGTPARPAARSRHGDHPDHPRHGRRRRDGRPRRRDARGSHGRGRPGGGDLRPSPREAYTRELLAAVPRIGEGSGRVATRAPEAAAPRPVPVVSVADLAVRFDLKGGLFGRVQRRVHAVEGVSFDIMPGETLSLVGESGCGKSTTAKALAGLVPYEGDIVVSGRNMGGLPRREAKAMRREIQMIFQDPFASLDPRMTVGDLVAEPMVIHGIASGAERRERVAGLFERVGLSPDQTSRYPHEFSGGQRQRICIARALALRPKLIIADESVSALDVSVQARVLELLRELQADFGIAYLFISHDMAVVENISDRVAVMYLGQIVEMGTRDQVFGDPQHPYTRRLIAAVPVPDPTRRRHGFPRLDTEIASPVRRPGDAPERLPLADVGQGHLVAA